MVLVKAYELLHKKLEVFVVKKTPKAHAHMVLAPQFITYTKFPLGFTSEQQDGSSKREKNFIDRQFITRRRRVKSDLIEVKLVYACM